MARVACQMSGCNLWLYRRYTSVRSVESWKRAFAMKVVCAKLFVTRHQIKKVAPPCVENFHL
jgi:hypothetical protein